MASPAADGYDPDHMDDMNWPAGRRRTVAAGSTLFRQGDDSLGLVLIESGMMELRRTGPGGQALTLHRAGPGETLAEAALFETAHHCDAIAVTDARLRIIGRSTMRRAAELEPDLPWRLAAHLARSLASSRATLARLAMPRAEDRLMDALLALPMLPDGTRQPPVSWRRLAQEIGLAQETVYRLLARLQREGTLARTRKGGAVLLRSPAA